MTPARRPLAVVCVSLVLVTFLAATMVSAGAAVGTDRTQQANAPPVAAFEYSPTNPEPGETVTLNASASNDPDGEIVTYRWDFDGDGQIDAEGGPNRRIAFPSAGTYEVGLTVVDDDGATNTTTRTVEVVGDQPPEARLNATPTGVAPGETVTLDPTGSSDPDGQIVAWEFDTDGDGTYDETYDSPTKLQVSYDEPGSYEVTLRVTDTDGLTATTSVTVVVESTSPTVTDGTESSPAGDATTPTPTTSDGGLLGTLDRLLPGGRLAAGLLLGLLVLLIAGGGLGLYWQAGGRRTAAGRSRGPVGSVAIAVVLVALLVGVPVAVIRGVFAPATMAEADLAVPLLELIGLAHVAAVLLLFVVLNVTAESPSRWAEATGTSGGDTFQVVGFVLVFLATVLLTVGAATLLLALELSALLAVAAVVAIGGMVVVPLTLGFVLVALLRG